MGESPEAAGSDPLIGRRLGDFEVRERIGAGGFGLVYRAEQTSLRREAVIKVLHRYLAGEAEVARRFLREATLASRLEHPFAAHVYAFGVEPDGLSWIGMEFVRGASLAELLRRGGPLSLEVFTPLFERLCEVVTTAHEQRIVHRDIKPANVMVMNRAGKLVPKLLDFGIAQTAYEVVKSERREVAEVSDSDRALDETIRASDDGAAVDDSQRLTRAGAVMGSPPYMAPEQWTDVAAVDYRADLYSLGILAFEALHGYPPFRGESRAELARAHLEATPPSVSPPLPERLDELFSRALAKDPADRPWSAMALAELFATCAGVRDQPVPVPVELESVLSTFASDGPQPLAELAAALGKARNPHEALALIEALGFELARYLALLCLACRSHGGPPGAGDPPEVGELLRRLRRVELTAADWRRLAAALAKTGDNLHLVPELAAAVDGGIVERLAELAGRGPTAAGEADLRDALEEQLSQLGSVLSALEFLCDYPIAVTRGQVAERWMGRRGRRVATAPLGDLSDKPADRIYLIDLAGRPVLSLDPLLVVGEPAPGRPPELFAVVGPGRRGARYRSVPDGYEIEDTRLWSWLRARELLGEIDESDRESGTPYPGLVPFSKGEARHFFGREREVVECLNRLRTESLLTVVGPSGAGKSSFVQAGLLASRPGWRDAYMRPGRRPLEALEAALAAVPEADVLVVDQLEELFTLSPDPEARDRFAAELMRASGERKVLITLRDDFLLRAETLDAWRHALGPSIKLLATPAAAELRRVLLEPARQTGYELDDPDLAGEIVEAVVAEPNALALLAFAARQLWERRDREFRHLTRRAYRAMGGVEGAIAHHAEAVLSDFSSADRGIARELFRHLVTGEGTRAVLGRDELCELAGDRDAAERTLERLLAARLLHTTDDGGVELAHEALLSAWPRLAMWRREDAEGARLRDEVRAAARQWEKRGRQPGLLWRGDALTELELWRRRFGDQLTDRERAFADASASAAARGRRLRRALVVVAMIVLAGAAAVLLHFYRRADAQRQVAEAHQREVFEQVTRLYQEHGRQALLADRPMRAITYLAAARQRGARGAEVEVLAGQALDALDNLTSVMEGHSQRIMALAVDRSAARALTGGFDGTARLWDLETGALLHTLAGHGERVTDVELGPGSSAVTASADGSAIIWDLETGEQTRRFGDHERGISRVVFFDSGTRVLTAGRAGLARIWDPATGEMLRELSGHSAWLWSADASPDGELVATASDDGTAAIWAAATGRRIAVLAHDAPVRWVEFDPSGQRLVTASWDTRARVWDRMGREISTFVDHTGPIHFARFSPDGGLVVTTSEDRSARVWDPETGELVAFLRGHGGAVNAAAFSPDSTQVATAASDNMVRVFSTDGVLLEQHAGHTDSVWRLAYIGDQRLVTASFDGTARTWTAREPWPLAATAPHDRPAVLAVDGEAVAWAGRQGQPQLLWFEPGSEPVELAAEIETTALGFTDQRELLVGQRDGSLEAIAIEGGRRRPVARLKGPVRAIAVEPLRVATATAIHRLGSKRSPLDLGVELDVAAFSPDGALLAGASGGAVMVWDANSGRQLWRRDQHALAVSSVAFSPGGGRLLSTSADKTAAVFSSSSGRALAELEGHAELVNGVFVTEDLIAAGAVDGFVRVFSADSGNQLGRRFVALGGARVASSAIGLVAAGPGHLIWTDMPRETRAPEVLAELARCLSPFELDGQRLTRAGRPSWPCATLPGR